MSVRESQMTEYLKNGPTTNELLEFSLLFLRFLLWWLGIHVDELGLSCGLLLNYTLDNKDIIIVIGGGHVRHSDWHRSGLLCWIVCGHTRNQVQPEEEDSLRYLRGGGLTTSLWRVGGNEGSSALTATVVAMFEWVYRGKASGKLAFLICGRLSTAPDRGWGQEDTRPENAGTEAHRAVVF